MNFLRAPRSMCGVTTLQTLAVVPPAIIIALENPSAFTIVLFGAVGTALACESVFTSIRKHSLSFHGIPMALVVAVLLPTDVALWQLILVTSLGVVFGEQMFGGRGFGFAHPATVALCLHVISYPEAPLPEPSLRLAVATIPGAVLLMNFGLVSWRVILGAGITVTVGLALRGDVIDPEQLFIALAFGLTFLICEPTSASVTRMGRLVFGALSGALIAVFSPGGTVTTEAIVFASMLTSIFAPLIDHLFVLGHAHRRRERCNA